jgi:hypothetical protein
MRTERCTKLQEPSPELNWNTARLVRLVFERTINAAALMCFGVKPYLAKVFETLLDSDFIRLRSPRLHW